MLEVILGQLWPYLLGALALIAGWVTARQTGKSAGKTEAKIKQLEAEHKAVGEAREVRQQMDARDAAAIRVAATKWVRGNKR